MENSATPINEQINPNNPFDAQPEVSIGKNALKYGLILGAISVLYSIILWLLGLSLNKPLGYVSLLFTIGVTYWGTLEYRNKQLKGFMTYGTAFSSNFLIAFYASIIGGVFTFLLYKYIDPSLVEQVKQLGIDAAMKQNPSVTQEQIEQGMEKMSFFTSPLFISIAVLFGGAIGAAIISLIVSIFHKKEQPLF